MNTMHPNLNNTLVRAETYLVHQIDYQAQSVVPQRRHAPGSLKYRLENLGLNPDPCLGPCDPFAKKYVLVQHLGTDIGSPGPCWGKEEQTASKQIPLTTGAVASHNSKILTFEGNPASYVQADGSGSMSSAPFG